jgi:hypothetical protein
MDALIPLVNAELGKHDSPLRINRAICDPILLRKDGGGINDKFVCHRIERCCCLHFNSVVTCMGHIVTELGCQRNSQNMFRII